jgi:hypothetical protein
MSIVIISDDRNSDTVDSCLKRLIAPDPDLKPYAEIDPKPDPEPVCKCDPDCDCDL